MNELWVENTKWMKGRGNDQGWIAWKYAEEFLMILIEIYIYNINQDKAIYNK